MNIENLFAEFLWQQKEIHSKQWRRGVREFAAYLMQFSDSDDTLPCPVCNRLFHVNANGKLIPHGNPRCQGSGKQVRLLTKRAADGLKARQILALFTDVPKSSKARGASRRR